MSITQTKAQSTLSLKDEFFVSNKNLNRETQIAELRNIAVDVLEATNIRILRKLLDEIEYYKEVTLGEIEHSVRREIRIKEILSFTVEQMLQFTLEEVHDIISEIEKINEPRLARRLMMFEGLAKRLPHIIREKEIKEEEKRLGWFTYMLVSSNLLPEFMRNKLKEKSNSQILSHEEEEKSHLSGNKSSNSSIAFKKASKKYE